MILFHVAKHSTDIKLREIYLFLIDHPNYRPNEYYMIIVPSLEGSKGFTDPSMSANWFVVERSYDSRVPAHELGHCNGLDEFAVNIGAISATNRGKAAGETTQRITSNVMGYGFGYGSDLPLKDFYSWQIELIRKNIEK